MLGFLTPIAVAGDWINFARAGVFDGALFNSGHRDRSAFRSSCVTRPRRFFDRRTHVRPPRNPHPPNASTIDLDQRGKGFVAVRLNLVANSIMRQSFRVIFLFTAKDWIRSLFITNSGHFVTSLPQKSAHRCFYGTGAKSMFDSTRRKFLRQTVVGLAARRLGPRALFSRPADSAGKSRRSNGMFDPDGTGAQEDHG